MSKFSKAKQSSSAPKRPDYHPDATVKNLAVVTVKDAMDVASIDAPTVSTRTDNYVKQNAFTYYLIINTWLLQVCEVSERACLELLEVICKLGLFRAIGICSDYASRFIESKYDLTSSIRVPEVAYSFLVTLASSVRDDKVFLQLLRYPKRFSPYGADILERESIDGLFAINKYVKANTRRGFSRYWVSRISDIVDDMLRYFWVDYSTGFFSSGVAADAARPIADKLEAYSHWRPTLYDCLLYPVSSEWWDPAETTAVVVPVPKDFRRARVIAEEDAYRQFHMQAIRIALEQALNDAGYGKYLDLHDQTPNQELAMQGSIDGGYATIDLSSASDSVARALVWETFPPSVCMEFQKYLPTHLAYGSRRALMHMFCTSGSAVTFPVESILFLAITLAVGQVCTAVTGVDYKPPCVFGDDMLVDASIFDTVCEVLGTLGFTVNTNKSYGDRSSYRESCGVEYTDGFSLQTVYWPRSVVSFRTEQEVVRSVGQLCALQHRLYSCYPAQKFLAGVVRGYYPNMTSHEPGTDCVDLWEDLPTFQKVAPPVAEGCTAPPDIYREVHLTLKTRRKKPPTGEKAALAELWLYANFLRHGPAFDDELLRVLRVSTKPPTRASLHDVGEQYWGTIAE